MAIEETEEFTGTERADAYLIVAKAAHSRTEGDPLWMDYREVAIDLQRSVIALREALQRILMQPDQCMCFMSDGKCNHCQDVDLLDAFNQLPAAPSSAAEEAKPATEACEFCEAHKRHVERCHSVSESAEEANAPESTAAGDVHYTDEFDGWWRANKRNDGAGLELSCKSQCYTAWLAGTEAVAELREGVADLAHRLESKEALLRDANAEVAKLRAQGTREDGIREAKLAYEAHTHVVDYNDEGERTEDCAKCEANFRDPIHLRMGESRQSRIDALLPTAPAEEESNGCWPVKGGRQ